MNKNIIFLALMLFFVSSVTAVSAGDVELHPGYFTGIVTVGSEPINRISVSASGGGFSGSTSSNSNSYTLTIEGGDWNYNIYATAYMNSNRDYMSFPSQTASVAVGETKTVNFNVTPGYVVGKITVNGGTLTSGYLYAYGTGSSSRTRINSDGTYRIPVYPNTNVRIYGTVYVNIGSTSASYSLPNKYVDVSSGSNSTVNWELDVSLAGGSPGSISGNVTVNGVSGTVRSSISAYGPSKDVNGTPYPWSSSFYKNIYGNGAYSQANLNPGQWYFYPSTYFYDYKSSLNHPYATYNRYVTLPPGGNVVNNFGFNPGFVKGSLILSGSVLTQDLNYAYVYGNGIYGAPSYGGYASTTVNTNTGIYDMVLSSGNWDVYRVNLRFYNSSSYLNNYINAYDYTKHRSYTGTPVNVTSGETTYNHDFNFQTGTVTIRFTVAGGGTLSSPRINGWNRTYENGTLALYTSVNAYGSGTPTTVGEVKAIALPGLYDFDAYAYVGGSYTKFGRIRVDVQPGTDKVIDIGGPELTITSPTPEYYTSGSSVNVSGTATDDTGVANVTVNGNLVTITSTNNPEDPNEVSFNTTLSINSGPNQVTIVATDTSGKIGSDSRWVYQDNAAPTLSWTPTDGTTTSDSSVTVSGTATDDNQITKITVNGLSVSLTPDTTTADPNDVTFTTTVNLVDGDNPIKVVATDNSKRTTSQIHTVTKSDIVIVEATVDVDPDTLNINSKSTRNAVTVYVELDGQDVGEIDVGSVWLNTSNGAVPAQLSPTDVGDHDEDGVPDRSVKFDRQSVIGIVDVGDNIQLTLTGVLSNGVAFEGTDIIRVIDKGGKN